MFTPSGAEGYDEGNRGFGLCPNPRLIEGETGSAGSLPYTKNGMEKETVIIKFFHYLYVIQI